jgi:hypothetical protein
MRGEALEILSLSLFGILFGHIIVNFYNEYRLINDELMVKVFVFRYVWVRIPWDEIISIRLSRMPLVRGMSSRAVQVRRLTFSHRFVGYFAGLRFHPCFIIGDFHQKSDELINFIETKLSERSNVE